MAKRKAKEEEQQAIEQKRKLRSKQLAQLKASNEMLEEAKAKVIEHYGEDSDTAKDYLQQIDYAKEDNVDRAREFLHASEEEMMSAQYNKVDPGEAKKYYDRLKNLGKSDEELHRKNLLEVVSDEARVAKNEKVDTFRSKLDKIKNMITRKQKDYEDVKPITKEEAYLPEDEPKIEQEEPEMKEEKNTVTEVHSIEEYNIPDKIERPYRCKGFDPRDVPDYVQYDIIPLPSKGECYPHKKNCLPVAYLTAADENIIASPNMYNNGNLIDILLERKILDKSIKVSELTKGDRDAIILWLRETAYGPEYPIVARYEDKEFETVTDLSTLKYFDFKLKGDENGYFDYTTESGDKLKFKFLTAQEEEELFQSNKRNFTAINTKDIIDFGARMLIPVKSIDDENTENVVEAIVGIQKWAAEIGDHAVKIDKDVVYNNGVTSRMCAYTMSVNGNSDRAYIKNYIENMRSMEARAYREYVIKNVPCVDFNIEVQIPESMGGGSFTTFLRLGESVFVNIK